MRDITSRIMALVAVSEMIGPRTIRYRDVERYPYPKKQPARKPPLMAVELTGDDWWVDHRKKRKGKARKEPS